MKADQPIPYTDARDGIAYAELLKLAHDEGLKSIATELVLQPSEDNGRLAIVKASVETERGHFEGLGDADPGSVDCHRSCKVPHPRSLKVPHPTRPEEGKHGRERTA